MIHLQVSFEQGLPAADTLNATAFRLNNADKHPIHYAPWQAFSYKPEVYFSIAYSARDVYLQYEVEEECVVAAHSKTNDPVYEDSCVEFFIGFDDLGYYNFEFNSIGTVLAGFGEGKVNRNLLPADVLKKIGCQVLHQKDRGNDTRRWQLTVIIPFEVFTFHCITSLKGKARKANFYKCGDALPKPHFLAWSSIKSAEPDFHQPEYFGTLYFN